MVSSPPPLPPSPSLDDLLVPSIPPIVNIPKCNLISESDDASLDIFPPIDSPAPLTYVPPPVQVQSSPPPIEFFFPGLQDKCYSRGRSRSRSRSGSPPSRSSSASPGRRHSPVRAYQSPIYVTPPSLYYPDSSASRSCTPESSRSPSPRPRRRRYSYRSRTPSPIRPSSYPYTSPQILYPPPPPPIVTMPSMAPTPVPPFVYRQETVLEPVDILTYHYNKNMAYAPAAKTYKEAMDNVLELWPELHEFDRDRIQLFVGGADQLVRVPKMAWQLVMCDLPRYEVMHVQVDELPPPPQYQSDGKGNWASGDEKKGKKQTTRSGGFFSSIKRIFWR